MLFVGALFSVVLFISIFGNALLTPTPRAVELKSELTTREKLADSVTEREIQNQHLPKGAITSDTVKHATIVFANMTPNLVESETIVNEAFQLEDMVDIASKIVDGSITTGDIAADSGILRNIVDGTNQLGDLNDNSVDSFKLVDGSITVDDIAASFVHSEKPSTVQPAKHSKRDDSRKYLCFFPIAGSSNQLYGVRKAFALAERYNRTLVLPPLGSSHIPSTGKYVSRSELFIPVQVNIDELNRTEAYFNTWFEVRQGILPTMTLQQFVYETGENQFMCRRTQTISVEKLESNAEWVNALDERRVLCVGNPWDIEIAAKPLITYIQFSGTVRSVGDDWITTNAVNRRFIATHIRRGDFNGWCWGHDDGCYLEFPDIFRQMEKYAQSFLSSSYIQKVDQETHTPHGMPLPVFFATNERNESQLQAMYDLGWKKFSAIDFLPAKQALLARGAQIGVPSTRELSSEELDLMDIFIDQYICTQAAFFVGNAFSTFSGVVYNARDCSHHNCKAWGNNTATDPFVVAPELIT